MERSRGWRDARHHPPDLHPGANGEPEPGAPGGGRGIDPHGASGSEGPQGAHGPHGHGHHGPGPGRGRGRAQRGDVRSAALLLLADAPMHGYQLMQAMADRTDGAWRPSPGAVYPTLAQLEDEGLVSVQASAGRKLVTLTDEGRKQADALRTGGVDPFDALRGQASDRPDLRRILDDLHVAARQIGYRRSRAQAEAAATALGEARRALYLILAEGEDG